MDEYIKQLLAELYPDNPTLPDVQNILDEPIPDSAKARLLKPLQPGKYRRSPPSRKAKERKRKALEEEFDPTPRQKSLRSVKEYHDDILDSFDKKEVKTEKLVFRQTPWVIGKFLRGWQMDVPKGHLQGANPWGFLVEVEPLIQKNLEELKALKGGLKFQLALKVTLSKDNLDGSVEYIDLVLRHRQEAEEWNQGSSQTSIPEYDESPCEVDSTVWLGYWLGSDPLAEHCLIPAPERWFVHPTACCSGRQEQRRHGGRECEEQG